MTLPSPGRVGLIVNPVAGLGGRVGLKGSDGPEIQRQAVALGAAPQAGLRTIRALRRLAATSQAEVLAAAGPMGAECAQAVGLPTMTLDLPIGRETSARDTRAVAVELAGLGVDLLLFAGGDGTACDVHDAIGGRVPVLGIPTGVKMHSGVFAATPEAAGEAAGTWLARRGERPLVEAEVADVDETAVRTGRIATRLHGRVLIPRDHARVLAAKGSPVGASGADLDGACARILADLPAGTTVLVGPGTTMSRALAGVGLPATLLGVDAMRDGALIGSDLDEREMLELLDLGGPAVLMISVVGGQGALLGRGNQQLSPAVLRRIGRDGLRVVAARDKLATLWPAMLRIDTGDPELDAQLSGHLPVRISARETIVMPVQS